MALLLHATSVHAIYILHWIIGTCWETTYYAYFNVEIQKFYTTLLYLCMLFGYFADKHPQTLRLQDRVRWWCIAQYVVLDMLEHSLTVIVRTQIKIR